MLVWILGVGVAATAAAAVFWIARWLERCPRCSSWARPMFTGGREPNPMEWEQSWKCGDCGNRWETRSRYDS